MGPMIWVEILIAALVMPPLVGIPMWLIIHGRDQQPSAIRVPVPARAADRPVPPLPRG